MSRPSVSSLAIELTAICNQHCAHCYNEFRADGGESVGAPTAATILAHIDRIREAVDLGHVTLTGGEPLSHPEILDILSGLQERGVTAQIISNGTLVDEAMAAVLAERGVRGVQITLNGPDAKTHDAYVGGRCFDLAVAAIENLKRASVYVVGCIVITRRNAALVAPILERFKALGVKQVALSRFSPAGYATERVAELLCSVGDFENALDQALPFAKDGMKLHVTMPIPPCALPVEKYKPIKFGACSIGTSVQEFAMGPDGRLRHCTLHTKSVAGAGDVLDADVAAVVESSDVREYKSRVPAFCVGCLHEKSCAGGCGAAAEWVSGDARAYPDPFLFQHVDDELAARLENARSQKDGKRRLRVAP